MAQLDRQVLKHSDPFLFTLATTEELQRDISTLTTSPVVDGLMKSVGGLFAVLNCHRQIIAVNDFFLRYVGVQDGGALLGLRPGEAINCLRVHDTPAGCGTGRYCTTCGSAIAITTSLAENRTAERKCAATIQKKGTTLDVCLNVRSTPYVIGGQRFVMLLLQDISEQERWAELEQGFIHDLGNIVTGLVGASEIHVKKCSDDRQVAEMIHRNSMRLKRELELRKGLSQIQNADYPGQFRDATIGEVVTELRDMFINNPLARNKVFTIADYDPAKRIFTDPPLLTRILSNLLVNAFEASDGGDEVRLGVDFYDSNVSFSVWNRKAIPEPIALRIFQRFFSTKAEYGRGIGTYMIKKFGEGILGGKVTFTSTEREGTEFHVTLPVNGRRDSSTNL